VALPDSYIEARRQQSEAMKLAKDVITDVGKAFEKVSGRSYGLMEKYRMDDAEVAMVILSSAAGTSKVAVDEMRKRGAKAGLIKPRVFRPFPYLEIGEALKNIKAVAVLDRADSYSSFGGPLFTEIRSGLYEFDKRPKIIGRVFGLGGRDYGVHDALAVFEELLRIKDTGKVDKLFDYITVRE